jgi:hypothetical protein
VWWLLNKQILKMNALALINLQIRLEYEINQQGMLEPFPGSSEQAWYVVYQHNQGYVPFFNHCLPDRVCQELVSLGSQSAFDRPEQVESLIQTGYRPCSLGKGQYWSGYFHRRPGPGEYTHVLMNADGHVIIQEGQIVSQARSIRQDEGCAEVYVVTQPSYQMHGYARQVVAAWAADILDSGRVPFYSYMLQNNASAALARSLGVVWFANVVAFGPA